MAVKSFLLERVLPTLPDATFVMAYGSGVFSQKSYSKDEKVCNKMKPLKEIWSELSKPVVDVILGVDNATSWHSENMKQNNAHYSFLKYLPNAAHKIATLQNAVPAHLYYNTLISVGDYVSETLHHIGVL